jgi:hypothetical protein
MISRSFARTRSRRIFLLSWKTPRRVWPLIAPWHATVATGAAGSPRPRRQTRLAVAPTRCSNSSGLSLARGREPGRASSARTDLYEAVPGDFFRNKVETVFDLLSAAVPTRLLRTLTSIAVFAIKPLNCREGYSALALIVSAG